MSAIQNAAIRSHEELNNAYAELEALQVKQSSQESTRLQLQRSGRDTEEISRQILATEKAIGEQEARAARAGLDFRTAMANLEAEQKLEDQQAKEAERQKAREQERDRQRTKDKEIDDLEL